MKFNQLSFLAIAAASTSGVAGFSPSSSFGVKTTVASSTSLDARKPFISGNWKLNPQTKNEATTLATDIAASINENTPDADIALFVPYVFIESAMASVDGKINVGAEVC